jgi:hypothetical protein
MHFSDGHVSIVTPKKIFAKTALNIGKWLSKSFLDISGQYKNNRTHCLLKNHCTLMLREGGILE